MSTTNPTEERGYFSVGGLVYTEPPRAHIKPDGDLSIRPFGMPSDIDLMFSMSIDRWRDLVAAVDQAITNTQAPAVSA